MLAALFIFCNFLHMYILYRATEKIFMFVYIILVAWKILCVMFCFEQREGERERERGGGERESNM